MSRIGKRAIELPSGVTVSVTGEQVTVKGTKGELSWALPGGVRAAVEGQTVVVERASESRQARSLHGLCRSMIANMVEGVSQGYKKELEIEGVGFRAAVQGQTLTLTLGFAEPKEYRIPEGVTVTVDGNTKLAVEGTDKQQVGEAAARIRAYFPAEPYKGKGIKYKNERIRRKVGKTVA